ncbi:hypothetical protein PROFUN_15165 [Planoprotostelium fungivorum]|uniref:Uncharacterized protein n=1 Tax=Planoprotostelium fungivorum TaxID=1890364 RepID=A0A2P6MTV2_9EUKA|nr:hypothetical protein PROFUN_15165 [Planoprotostelium fungivorum]
MASERWRILIHYALALKSDPGCSGLRIQLKLEFLKCTSKPHQRDITQGAQMEPRVAFPLPPKIKRSPKIDLSQSGPEGERLSSDRLQLILMKGMEKANTSGSPQRMTLAATDRLSEECL